MNEANSKTEAATNSSEARDIAKFDLRDAALPVITTDMLFICALENEVGDYTFESVRANVQGGERARQITNGGVHWWPKGRAGRPVSSALVQHQRTTH